MDEFTLETWERAPRIEETVFPGFHAHVQWQGREEGAHIASIPSLSWIRRHRSILFRVKSAPSITYVLMETVVSNSSSAEDDVAQLDEPTEEEIVMAVRQAVTVHPPLICRPFFFDDDTHFVLVRAQSGEWRGDSSRSTRFRLPPFALQEQPCSSRQLFEWLQGERQDKSSETNFALRWRQDQANSRFDFAAQLCPSLLELQSLMKWVLLCMPLDFEVGALWKIQNEQRSFLRIINAKRSLINIFESQDQPPFLRKWNHFLFSYFHPLPALDETLPLCVLDWFHPGVSVVVAHVEKPTQHERLEARLHLREWLQQNALERMDLLP